MGKVGESRLCYHSNDFLCSLFLCYKLNFFTSPLFFLILSLPFFQPSSRYYYYFSLLSSRISSEAFHYNVQQPAERGCSFSLSFIRRLLFRAFICRHFSPLERANSLQHTFSLSTQFFSPSRYMI